MRTYILLSLAVLLAPALAAQQRDSVRAPGDTAEAGRLRREIEQRFSNRVQEELKLTPDQTTKLRASQERFGTRRRTLIQQQMERRRALQDQMQPGMAPTSQDTVRKLMDGLQGGRAEMVKIDQDENREMAGYLSPVQQARFQQMREQFIRRVGEMRMERREGRGMGRGGVGPRRPAIRGGARRRGI